jgi:hypothetical protein
MPLDADDIFDGNRHTAQGERHIHPLGLRNCAFQIVRQIAVNQRIYFIDSAAQCFNHLFWRDLRGADQRPDLVNGKRSDFQIVTPRLSLR